MRLIKQLRKFFMSPLNYAKWCGVKVGNDCFISTKNWPTEAYLVEVGDHVRIAGNTSFFTHGGIYTIRKYYNDPNLDRFGKIKIGDYTSIGENCIINPGVSIGKCCIVGGGSVVTKSIPDGCMVGGNPAKFIGYTEEFYKRIKGKSLECKGMSPEEKKKYLLSLPDEKFDKKPYIKLPDEQKR